MDYRYDIFISSSRLDYDIIDKVASVLYSGGFTYFRDQQGLQTGSDFLETYLLKRW